jgi:hypothetical protein
MVFPVLSSYWELVFLQSYFSLSPVEISMGFMVVRMLKFHTVGQSAGVKRTRECISLTDYIQSLWQKSLLNISVVIMC